MIQSQDLLSRLGIAYNDCQSQADVDAKAHAIIDSYHAKQTGKYITPGLQDGNLANFLTPDWQQIQARDAAMGAMRAAEQVGNVTLAHADLDNANRIGTAIGFPVVACDMSDLEILAHMPGKTGDIAQLVAQGDMLSDMVKAKAIIEPALTEIPKSAPVATTPPYIELPGPLAGYTIGQGVPAADGSHWIYCVLPFGPTYRLVRQLS